MNVKGLSLAEKVLVCKLRLSLWRAGVTDKEVTEETNNRYKASKAAGSYRKRLMSEQLKPVRSAFGEVNKFHKENTAPWNANNGQNEGILLVDHYQKYRDGIEEKRRLAMDKVDEFVLLYPNHLSQARRDLGEMFKSDEYPAPTEIRKFFEIDSEVYPVPDPSDWRVSLSSEEVERLKARFEARMEASLQASMASVWQRLYEPVKKMAETLSEADKGFHKTLVTNIVDVIQVLPALNITGDPQLEQMRKEIERKLCRVKAPELKNDPGLRVETAEAAKEIMDKLAVFAGPLPN